MESPLSTRKFFKRAWCGFRIDIDHTARFLVERIMTYNVFGCLDSSLNTHKNMLASESKEPTGFGSCDIWTQASYLNHSCVSNVRRAFIGDMMIVRASRDLETDTELSFLVSVSRRYQLQRTPEKAHDMGIRLRLCHVHRCKNDKSCCLCAEGETENTVEATV
jgi:hypothetical protein